MGNYALSRFTAPNAGVSVSEAGTDGSTTAALGLAVQNLDTHAANKDTANNFTALQEFSAGISPDGVATLTLPAATDTLVGKATTDTLTNKTLTGPRVDVIKDTSGNTVETITAGGGVQVGSPTGGDKGAGTVNATGLYVNGAALSSGTVILGFGSAAVNFQTKQYIAAGGNSPTEADVQLPMAEALTLTKLYFRFSTTPVGVTITTTVRKNAADSAITATVNAAQSGNDTAHSVALAAGDLVDVSVVDSASESFRANIQIGT